MDPLRMLVEQKGFFTRAEARQLGYGDRAVAAAMRAGVWHRFRRGYYSFPDVWSELDEVGRHRVRSSAVMNSLGGRVALSHVSGCIAHGVDVWGIDLSRVHVTRLDGGPGRIEGDVVHHEGLCLDEEVVEVDGMQILLPARCALEAGSRTTNEAALVLLDSLLHKELTTPGELMERFVMMQRWPFMQHLHIPVRMADGRSASVGESRGRYLFWVCGVPAPHLQFQVHGPGGRLLGTTDWAWPELGALGEFDGKVKYGRLLRPGLSAGDVMFAEKQREELLCQTTGMRMVRIIWVDYDRPRITAARVQRALKRVG